MLGIIRMDEWTVATAALATAMVAPPAMSQPCLPLEQARLEGGDGYGSAIAVDGDVAAVGAFLDGSAWILELDKGRWSQAAQLVNSAAFPFFGVAVDVSGDTAVVGASWELAAITPGHALVYRRDQGGPDQWGLVAELVPADGATDLLFGLSVAIDGDTIVVGAPGEFAAPMKPGAAYVFERDLGGPDAWGQRAQLFSLRPVPGERFGASAAISGDTVAVGADHPQISGIGEVTIFERDLGGPDAWGLATVITPSNGAIGDEFGCAVALDGDRLIVGAKDADAAGTPSAGAAYAFERDVGGPGAWGEVIQLVAPDAQFGDDFGAAVDARGDQVIVGAPLDDPGGSVHVFDRDQPAAGAWGHLIKLTGSSVTESARFGDAVAIEAGMALIGAWNEEPDGAAYVFAVDGPDCNVNGVPDACDILLGDSEDDDGNGVPDECETDCDGDGVVDVVQIANNPYLDCDGSGALDSCEIAGGVLSDFNGDGYPDVCDPLDCDGNGTPDVIDIGLGGAADCNANFMIDGCETAAGLAWDDGLPENAVGSGQGVDAMLSANPFDGGSGAVIESVSFALYDDGNIELGDPVSVYVWDDPDDDGVPDDAVLLRAGVGTVQVLGAIGEPAPFNVVPIAPVAVTGGFFAGVITTTAQFPMLVDDVPVPLLRSWGIVGFDDPDAIQMAPSIQQGVALVRAGEMDCNANAVPDPCDIADGLLGDDDGDGIPDDCDCPADLDGDGAVSTSDLLALLAAWGPGGNGPPDLDFDGIVGARDLEVLLTSWGGCP